MDVATVVVVAVLVVVLGAIVIGVAVRRRAADRDRPPRPAEADPYWSGPPPAGPAPDWGSRRRQALHQAVERDAAARRTPPPRRPSGTSRDPDWWPQIPDEAARGEVFGDGAPVPTDVPVDDPARPDNWVDPAPRGDWQISDNTFRDHHPAGPPQRDHDRHLTPAPDPTPPAHHQTHHAPVHHDPGMHQTHHHHHHDPGPPPAPDPTPPAG